MKTVKSVLDYTKVERKPMKVEIKIKRLYAKINKIEMEILALQEGSELPITLADLVTPDEAEAEREEHIRLASMTPDEKYMEESQPVLNRGALLDDHHENEGSTEFVDEDGTLKARVWPVQ